MYSTPSKRKDTSDDGASAAKRQKNICSYGENCYRRNPAHFRELSHPHLENILNDYSGSGSFKIPERLSLQTQAIEEQLKIIIDRQIYVPNSNIKPKSPVNQNKGSSVTNTGSSVTNTGSSVSNTGSSVSNTGSSSSKAERLNSNKGSSISKTESEKQKLKNSILNTKPVTSKESSKKELEVVRSLNMENKTVISGQSGSVNQQEEYRPMSQPARKIQDHFSVVLPKGLMAEKHKKNAPYYIFYTTIAASKETHRQANSITFQELLDPSLGELKASLQLNFMVDIGWLLAQYYFAGYSNKKLTILYGEDMPDLRTINQKQKNVEAHMVAMATPFGKHHTKLMLLCYEDGSLRVVVSTANLYMDDWENRTQGLWMSPNCPELPDGAMPHEGDSVTGFKKSLLNYLNKYGMSQLTYYVEKVRRCDFSHINVFFVASVPGGHFDSDWSMLRVSSLLKTHCKIPANENHKWPLVAQASSIGSYGKEPKLWLTGDFQHHFCRIQNQNQLLSTSPKLQIIYPSLENVKQSHDGLLGGGCLPYAADCHSKQPWLNTFLHQWKATHSARDKAMPHIKSYLRADPTFEKVAYYILTSANISKAAWGTINKGNSALRVMSYEAGVMFLPKFIIDKDFFTLNQKDKNYLPIPYDLPPVPYTSSMSPWVSDYLH